MSTRPPAREDRPIGRAARIIRNGFVAYTTEFHRLTRQAQARFEARDWAGAQRDALKRLELYGRTVRAVVRAIEHLLGPEIKAKSTWRALKEAWSEEACDRRDADICETFFNSVTRRVFATVGVDPQIEFIASEVPSADDLVTGRVTWFFDREGPVEDLVRAALLAFPLTVGFEDVERDAAAIARVLAAEFPGRDIRGLELARSVFYRNKGAYLVGRVLLADGDRPLALALLNPEGRIVVDAVLPTEEEVSIVFSFTRSYFLVDAEYPAELVRFLAEIMPKKPVAELYTAIGQNKHGKTEFYRALLGHLDTSDDRFEVARGARGMVMIVFTLPSYDVVFKVIRDRFSYPKNVTRQQVMDKYRLVFRHDRAGRLVDAQEFEHLAFECRRFSEPLLDELLDGAASTVERLDGHLVVHHLYTERRLVPLDLYLREAPPDAARRALLDYGQVLRDLAATNIFPGDLLLKNFGVSRHGRVIFYDYDELALLTETRFRALPASADGLGPGGEEAWFYVGEHDVFPEEFLPFLGLPPALREVFLAHHGDLLKPEFWWAMQDEHRAGRVPDILPYTEGRRLRDASGYPVGSTGTTT